MLTLIPLIAEHTMRRLEEMAERGNMKDEVLVKLCAETAKWLCQTITVNPAPQMIPSYNAVLEAAKANHPESTFLRVLQPLETDGEDMVSVGEMLALFGQIRIVLEAYTESARHA